MEDFMNSITGAIETYGPPILKAIIILAVAYVVAKIVAWAIAKAIDATGFAKTANEGGTSSIGKDLSVGAFWLVILFGIIEALGALGATEIKQQITGILDPIMGYVPRIVGAILVFAAFFIVAKIAQKALKPLLTVADGMPQRFGMASGPTNISGTVSYAAFGFLVLVGAISALNALSIQSISGPLNTVLGDIVEIIPRLLVALVLLGLFGLLARFVGTLAARLLPVTGIDSAVSSLGILKGADSGMTASSVISKLIMFFLGLIGLVAAVSALNIPAVTNILNIVLEMAAQIVFGAVIIFAGVFIARLVTGVMASTGSGATDVAASVVKWVIIVLAVIVGISRMGLDPTGGEFILNVAEYLVIGGAAGLAIAFGWGGKDWAAKKLETISPSDATTKPARATKTTK